MEYKLKFVVHNFINIIFIILELKKKQKKARRMYDMNYMELLSCICITFVMLSIYGFPTNLIGLKVSSSFGKRVEGFHALSNSLKT